MELSPGLSPIALTKNTPLGGVLGCKVSHLAILSQVEALKVPQWRTCASKIFKRRSTLRTFIATNALTIKHTKTQFGTMLFGSGLSIPNWGSWYRIHLGSSDPTGEAPYCGSQEIHVVC